jgi:hypothetical protein
MKRIIMMLTVAAMMVTALTVTSAGAFAASPSQERCEAGGGEFDRQQGQVICEQDPVVTPGKNEKQEKFNQTSQTTDTGQGNINNKEDSDTTTTCGTPCPPGQFK